MKQLGIGIQVFIGFAAVNLVAKEASHRLYTTGIITDGPRSAMSFSHQFKIDHPHLTFWRADSALWAEESMLVPFDDDPEALTTELETANLLED